MLDDERKGDSTIFEEEASDPFNAYSLEDNSGGRALGMTAGQRFLLSLMLFIAVAIVGLMVLLVAEKIWIY
jgi:hypothetical protein